MELRSTKIALLVVDVQTALIEEHPYQEERLITGIKDLLSECRRHRIEVVYIRHSDKEELVPGTSGWQIYDDIKPEQDEKLFDKNFNSAFRRTGLKEYLEQKGIQTIILVGLQTEYCIDATCKVAFEYDYEVIIPEGLVSTFDNSSLCAEEINRYYKRMWDNRYGKVKSLDEVKVFLQGETR